MFTCHNWQSILHQLLHIGMLIKPKLAETALLFCRVTDELLWQKNGTTNEPKFVETALLVSDSIPRIYSEANKDQVVMYAIHVRALAATCCGGCPGDIPGPSTPPVFDCLEYA